MFEDRARRRAVRTLLAATAAAVLAVVVVGATAISLVRREPGAQAVREASVHAAEELRVQPQAAAPAAAAARAVAKVRGVDLEQLRHLDVDQLAQASGRDPARKGAAAERERRQAEQMARDVIDALAAAGETEGLAAFPPPGTDPIKVGLVVPDGFELPEGYVRHYQITDQGERLAAILMFSPDHEFVDAAGRPITTPQDRIVPPHMAPPGLPVQMLQVPKDPYGAGRGGRGR